MAPIAWAVSARLKLIDDSDGIGPAAAAFIDDVGRGGDREGVVSGAAVDVAGFRTGAGACGYVDNDRMVDNVQVEGGYVAKAFDGRIARQRIVDLHRPESSAQIEGDTGRRRHGSPCLSSGSRYRARSR